MKFLNYKSNIETFSISIRDVQASCPVNIFPFSFEEKWRGYNIKPISWIREKLRELRE